MPAAPGVRVLPNALTVLAVCAGLSAVQFALDRDYTIAIAMVAAAAVLDGLDGRIARLLDATSKIGAELDSLCDAVSFGAAPALVMFGWKLHEYRIGWVVTLVFAVCTVLRLARFNTLLDDAEQPPYAKEFFVGVPAPAGGLLVMLPLMLQIQIGSGWWTSQLAVALWTVAVAALLISRVPTLSVKTIKVPPRAVAPLLVLVGLLAAAVVAFPLGSAVTVTLIYLVHIPYAIRRRHWLAAHPEAWEAPPRERRAIRRSRSVLRLGLRPPRLRRVAGAARRAVRLPQLRPGRPGQPIEQRVAGPVVLPAEPPGHIPGVARRRWRRTGLRHGQPPRP